MKILNNKKSQIFTLISIALLILFFVTYELYSVIYEREAVKTRIKTMNSFLFSIEQDLERQFYISGFRTIFLAEDKITKNGSYIQNFTKFFEEAVYNGSIDGQPSDILYGTTIENITSSIQEKAGKMNLNIAFFNIKVSIGQEDPWNIVLYFNAILNLTDKSNLAAWYKNESIKSYISIEGFEDPFYTVNTYGKVSRKIYKTIYEGSYVNGADKTNLSLHLEKKYYANNTDAPSFIKRLEGKNEADSNGIENFVYLPDLSNQGVSVLDKSIVDHIYFSQENPSASQVSGMPSWFKIDSAHKPRYQIS